MSFNAHIVGSKFIIKVQWLLRVTLINEKCSSNLVSKIDFFFKLIELTFDLERIDFESPIFMIFNLSCVRHCMSIQESACGDQIWYKCWLSYKLWSNYKLS